MRKILVFISIFGLIACGGGGGAGTGSGGRLAVKAELVAGDLSFPVGLAPAPDGRFFFTELKTGRVRILTAAGVLPVPFASIDVPAQGTDGLLGIALDTEFETNGFVYVFTTAELPLRNQVLRYRAEGNLGTEPAIILDNLPNGGHNGGKIASAPDGTVFVSTGDAGDPALSQDPATSAGKILRVNRDGSIPSDNPIPGSPVYALGFRNVFGLAIDPRSSRLFASENGPECDDELNLIEPGGNYGWRPGRPCGDDDDAFIRPLEVINPPLGLTGITFYRGDALAELTDKLLVGDINTGAIRAYLFDPSGGAPLGAEILFEGNPAGILEIAIGSDGLVYFTTQNAIYRLVRETGPNESAAPVSG